MPRYTMTRLSLLAIAAVLTVGCAEPGKSPLEPAVRPALAATMNAATPLSQGDESRTQIKEVVPQRASAPASDLGRVQVDSVSERTIGKIKRFSGYVVSSGRHGPTTGDDENAQSHGNNGADDQKLNDNGAGSNDPDTGSNNQY